jgi:PAS domain S-box-containing protein
MIVTFDTEGRLLFTSPSYLEIFDKTEDELIGKKFMPLIYEEDRGTVAKAIAKVHKPPYNTYVEERVMTKDGWRWQAWVNTGVLNEQDKVESIVAVGRDISEQKQTEEALRKSEKKYRNLLETTTQGYWMVNPEFKNIEVNLSLCKMLGYRPDEMLGKTPFDFVDDVNRKIFYEQLSKISATSHRSYEITLKKKNGEDVNTFINATTIRDESGEVQGAFALITDITDMKQTEQRLKQREKELERKSIRLEEMNTALKILLEKRDEDKKELEEKIMTNVKELVLPYVTKLKNTDLNDRQEIFADIIHSNIEEIISPFAHKLSHKYLNFTPTEIKVAFLVKQGLRTKEIAKMLGSSPETITRHRKSMRKKLKLTDKKSNLRTHLLSLANGHIE